jgi:hypothetical protein
MIEDLIYFITVQYKKKKFIVQLQYEYRGVFFTRKQKKNRFAPKITKVAQYHQML